MLRYRMKRLVNLLFDKNPEKAINKVVDIDGNNYRVIGALKSEALVNESIGAGYIERNWPPALKHSTPPPAW